LAAAGFATDAHNADNEQTRILCPRQPMDDFEKPGSSGAGGNSSTNGTGSIGANGA